MDWGEATVIMGCQERKVQLFCLKLFHCHRVFIRANERANIESSLDGHVRALRFLGGVSKRTAYDNLRSAVIQVGQGRVRKLIVWFLELHNWYLFESQFCHLARGNDKGHVENLVKQAQRTFLTPLSDVANFEELNREILEDCKKEMDGKDNHGRFFRILWDLERSSL